MRIHDMLAQVSAPFAGKTLSKEMLAALVIEAHPGTNPASILPGDVDDFDRGETGATWKQGNAVLFHRVSRGSFLVLPVAERIPAKSNERGARSNKTQAQLVAEARALLATIDNKPVTVVSAIPAKVEVKADSKPATK